VAIARALPIAIVAAVLTLATMVWWCCRACGNCRTHDQGSGCHGVLLIATGGLVIASVALLVAGFAVDREQSDAMKSVPELVDSIEEYSNDIGTLVVGPRASQYSAAITLLPYDSSVGPPRLRSARTSIPYVTYLRY
jgi:hypothetical protein